MRKLFAALVILGFLFMGFGCTGINTSTVVNTATDAAFVMALKNNPDYKAPVVKALTDIKAALSGELTYDDLIAEVTKRLDGDYAYFGLILQGYVETDKPVFESSIGLLDSYKEAVIAKIDRLLLLAGAL